MPPKKSAVAPWSATPVCVNQALPAGYLDAKGRVKADHCYVSNQGIILKYNVPPAESPRAVPQGVANFSHQFSTISPCLVFPLLACKDAYEDTKRHQSGRTVNQSSVLVLDMPNPNPMQAKSRTFVRGVRNLVRRRPRDEKDVDGDDDGWKLTAWEDVRMGDIVKIRDDEPLPADILICPTSEDDNVAFVETKNLDGETNLKSRHAAAASLTHLTTASAFADASFHVDCERPDTNMYCLNGAVFLASDSTSAPFDLNMTLLRGTVLRNTRWVVGVDLFTCEDTKIILNSGGTPQQSERAAMANACGIVDSILKKKEYLEGAPWLLDDDTREDNPSFNGLVTWAFALFPTSCPSPSNSSGRAIYFDSEIWYEKTDPPTLACSWNLSGDLGQIEYIFLDKTGTLMQNSMSRAPTDGSLTAVASAGAHRRPSLTLREERHQAALRRRGSDPRCRRRPALWPHSRDSEKAHARSLNGFFTVLALCHLVLADINTENGQEEVSYKAQSPDEAALVQAAPDSGYVFRGREQRNGVLVLALPTPSGAEERYELLNVLEFTSARKRMSVIVKKLGGGGEDAETETEAGGRLLLLSKGADNVIFERLKAGVAEELKEQTEEHLDEFASNGLRALTLAYKVLQEDEYDAWNQRYPDAMVTLDEQILENVPDEIEHDLRLLGATAIEDKLQDGVPETIADLKRAGIKVWVATGDKLETAIAIGHSTNLIGKDSNIIVIRNGDEGSRPVYDQLVRAVEEFFPESEALKEIHEAQTGARPTHHRRTSSSSARRRSGSIRPVPLARVNTGVSSIVGADNGERPGGFVLVIDGTALGHAFDDERNKETLLSLAMLCEGVICCRVSPLQKALVVHLVKDGIGAMTLAIGDGANDVSMIQAADVGVGISGEEGLQAVNSSDYAIAQFRFLKRLMLVHGHWSYARNGNMILNFFYKNIVCIGVLWWFQIYNSWSSSYVFEYTYLLWWNAFWTIAPVIAMGIFDRLIDADTLMALPELYRYGREGRWFGFNLFSVFMLDGVYQSAIIFFIIIFAYDTTTARTDGYNTYQYEIATTMAMSAILCANLFNGLNTNFWTAWVFFAVFLGIVLSWGYTAIYSIISPGWISTPIFGNDHYLFHSAYYWFCVLFCVLVALLPRYLYRAWEMGFSPNDIALLRAVHKIQPNVDIASASAANGAGAAPLSALRRPTSHSTINSQTPHRPRTRTSGDWRMGSRTDMATGLRTFHHGFDFSTEEGGVAMRRIQTGLSEPRQSRVSLANGPKGSRLGSIFTIRRKKGEPQ
ncbi:Phospholipid-transporting ATPase [Mycena chlorophos]|uniref:Phospholipid-transporting ATPase n=1 Tax=Mycena chlorophos TaxID=658473 RepID=A0A8H6TRZ2_MYCCL|nr:Phospholipid-transporting ATPase [Mycena chlorophos]